MPEEKNYINGIILKEKIFDNGGTQLKVSIKLDEFVEQLKTCEQDKDFKGWINCCISRRKSPSDKGVTHYMYEDTWKPDPNYSVQDVINDMGDGEPTTADKHNDDLPF